jgi:hypothetical protein
MHERRYDLDWLRVLVFALLIFYHIGMLYVSDWGFHYKSQYQSEFLQNIMLLANPWRLPLLFFISGIATRFYLQKVSVLRFLSMRTVRLLLPLMFAMLFIIPPQLYVEMIGKGDLPPMSYWQFSQLFWDFGNPIFTKYSGLYYQVDVNHLWYIRELWWLSIILVLLIPLLKSRFMQSAVDLMVKKDSPILLIVAPTAIFSVLVLLIFPDGELYRITRGFSYMLIGYVFAFNQNIWAIINKHRRVFLYLSILSYLCIISYNQLVWMHRDDSVEISIYLELFEIALSYLNRWLWMLMVLGYASEYLHKNNACLKYFNAAVYPYYILHQSILIVVAYYLTPFQLGGFWESVIVITTTFTGCFIGFEIIRRIKYLRPLFGLKLNANPSLKPCYKD